MQFLNNNLLIDFEKIIELLNSKYLTLNFKKSKYVIFIYKNLPQNLNFVINGNIIARSFHVDFLGVRLDKKLSFKEHIFKVAAKVSKLQDVFFIKLVIYLLKFY